LLSGIRRVTLFNKTVQRAVQTPSKGVDGASGYTRRVRGRHCESNSPVRRLPPEALVYIGTLRKNGEVPVFQVSQDHLEVGHILPNGGSVLYLRGPAMSWWAIKRSEGMERTKPKNIEGRSLKVLAASAEGEKAAV
jgi:hypothetical protein